MEVRRLVAHALVQREAPDTRTGALIDLVHAVGCVDKVVDPRHYVLSRRELRARAKEIAEGSAGHRGDQGVRGAPRHWQLT